MQQCMLAFRGGFDILLFIFHKLFLVLLQTYIAPQAALFGEIQGNPNVLFNNLRVYGTILLLLMSVVVFVGVKFVSQFTHITNYVVTCNAIYKYIFNISLI